MPQRTEATWIVVGSSPGVEEIFDATLAAYPGATTITCNAGVNLFFACAPERVAPDYYWLSDFKACGSYRRAARTARAMGTRVVSFHRDSEQALAERGITRDDLLIRVDEPQGLPRFTPGKYVMSGLSGTLCVQFALNHGASRVVLIGHDGYRSSTNGLVVDNFDGRTGKPGSWEHNERFIRPLLQSCIQTCPGVEFIQYGKPLYALEGPNYRLAKRPEGVSDVALCA